MGDRSQRDGLLHGRLRKPERAARRLGLLLGFILLLPSPVHANPLFLWTLDVALGHDDEILADPLQLGIVSPVSDAFMSGSSRFLLRWADLKSDHRLDLLADVGGVVYGDKVEGGDTELEGTIAYRRRLFDPLALDLSASGAWFRRDEQAEGEPVFDQDLYGIESRLGWALGSDWVIAGGGRYDWARYPGRELEETEEKEKQEQGTALLSCARRFGARDRITAEFLYRRLESNVFTSDFDGPTAVIRAKLSLFRFNLTPAVVYGHRSFDSFLTEDSLDTREDDSWQYGLSVVRPLSPRLSVFADGSFLHQVSNVSDFDFDEARVSAGFAFELVSSRTSETVLTRPPVRKLAPQITPSGVRFRYTDPGAQSVSVVGDWNGWTPGRDVLGGPAKSGLWEGTVVLKPGIWRYAFVVDGVWQEPPDAPRTEDDGFGGRQGLLEVPPP